MGVHISKPPKWRLWTSDEEADPIPVVPQWSWCPEGDAAPSGGLDRRALDGGGGGLPTPLK